MVSNRLTVWFVVIGGFFALRFYDFFSLHSSPHPSPVERDGVRFLKSFIAIEAQKHSLVCIALKFVFLPMQFFDFFATKVKRHSFILRSKMVSHRSLMME
jgi:hypothetical protein